MRTYRRKTKVIGKETYINQATGQLVEMNVIQAEEKDFNFEKLWVGHIVQTLDIIGNKKTKIIFHIIQNRNRDNIFIGTYKDLEKKLNVSTQTVAETLKVLQKNDILVMLQQGVYRLNPNIVFKGTNGNRMNILIQYQNEKAEAENDKQEEAIDQMEYIETELKEAKKRVEELERKKEKIASNQESETKEQMTS